MSAIQIDPFDPDKVIYTTGEGLWGSANITAADSGKPALWGFPNEGLEETVVNQIVSPPQGAPLLSVVSDIGGFRHEDLDRSPAKGFFTDPQLNSSTGLDFAALAPSVIVRVGYGDGKTPRGAYSMDDGATWRPFASEPASSRKGAGKVAISADGKTVVWSPEKGTPFWTSDWGKSWSPCLGLTEDMRVESDRVNPSKFYSFNRETGQLLESLDQAQSFAVRIVPVAPKGNYDVVAATPGMEGDLWVAAGNGVFHTADSGVTFVSLDGMSKVLAIGFGRAADGSSHPAIYINGIAAAVEGIYRSDDAGHSWVRVDDPEHQFGWKNSITGDPRMYGRVYLATGGRGIVYGDPLPAKQIPTQSQP
jgi:hypothetical protein